MTALWIGFSGFVLLMLAVDLASFIATPMLIDVYKIPIGVSLGVIDRDRRVVIRGRVLAREVAR